MNTSHLKLLTLLTLCAWLCLPGLLWSDESRLSAVEVDDPKDPTDWWLGKIEPAVEEAWKTQDELEVIVYLRSSAAKSSVPTPRKIKALHLPAIEELSQRIRAIEKRYRPTLSVPEDQEVSIGATLDYAKSDVDKAELLSLRIELKGRLDRMRVEVGRAIMARVAAEQAAMAELIENVGGRINARIPLVNALGAVIPGWFLVQLVEDPRVAAIVEDRMVEDELDVSMLSTGADEWHRAGFDGFREGARVWTAGIIGSVSTEHPALAGINFEPASGYDLGGHGTHLAGIIASRDPEYEGLAHGLEAVAWRPKSSTEALNMESMYDMAESSPPPDVVNYSNGSGIAGAYRPNDAFFDAYVESFNIPITTSAGNQGWDHFSPTITHPANAYNLLAVANMDDQNTLIGPIGPITHPGAADKWVWAWPLRWRSDDRRAENSSVGPTSDDRKKPDIAAPGTNIRSPNWNFDGGGSPAHPDDLFIDRSGTSAAAAHVAAAVLLLADGGNVNPMAQKAVLINTADAWTSNGSDNLSDDGRVSGSWWDKSYGWGYLDLMEAYFNRSDFWEDSVKPNDGDASQDDFKLYAGFMHTGEKATLVWHKRSSSIENQPVPGQPPELNYALSDLNLELYDEYDGSIPEDADSDSDDNVHQVAATEDIDAVIKVYAQSSSFQGTTGGEDFALATEEHFRTVQFPDAFTEHHQWSALDLEPGVKVVLRFWVVNNGEISSHSNEFDLDLPAGWTRVEGADPFNAGSVRLGNFGSLHALWTLKPPDESGLHIHTIKIHHTHDSYGESFQETYEIEANIPEIRTILVDNAGFEDTEPLTGKNWNTEIESWLQTGLTPNTVDSGTFRPEPEEYFHEPVPEGVNTSYSDGGTISQTIPAERLTLVSGTTYALEVDIGKRHDVERAGFPGYEIQLVVVDEEVPRASADESIVEPAAGEFETAMASFTATEEDEGKQLEIRLVGKEGKQTNFDNVRLTSSRYAFFMLSAPTVTINSPTNGSQFSDGTNVPFDGDAEDREHGDLGDDLSWFSSLDGIIGSGESFETSSLSCGIHSITASVTDASGLSGSDAVTFTVIGGFPVPIEVVDPSFEELLLADGGCTQTLRSWTRIAGVCGTFNPTTVQFPGGVPDGENSAYVNGGTIGQTIAGEPLLPSTTYTLEVDVGDRTDKELPDWEIQLLVVDPEGEADPRARANQGSVSIAEGEFETATASFTTTAADAGKSVEIRLVSLGEQVNFDNVRLTRWDCEGSSPPVVEITTPAAGSSIPLGRSVRFAGRAVDAEDLDLAAGLSWRSSLDGAIGTGAEIETSLSCGVHMITASVTDLSGLPGADAITLTVAQPIAVANPGFEDQDPLPSRSWHPDIPEWDELGLPTGTFRPDSELYFHEPVPEGVNSAYSDGGTIRQTIAEELLADTTYKLEVDVGRRADQTFPGYKILLVVEGEDVHRARVDESILNPAAGEFETATLSFTTTQDDEGKSVEIRLVGRPGKQTNFDNVWLTRSVCGGDPSDPG